jgi:hypothetical protein
MKGPRDLVSRGQAATLQRLYAGADSSRRSDQQADRTIAQLLFRIGSETRAERRPLEGTVICWRKGYGIGRCFLPEVAPLLYRSPKALRARWRVFMEARNAAGSRSGKSSENRPRVRRSFAPKLNDRRSRRSLPNAPSGSCRQTAAPTDPYCACSRQVLAHRIALTCEHVRFAFGRGHPTRDANDALLPLGLLPEPHLSSWLPAALGYVHRDLPSLSRLQAHPHFLKRSRRRDASVSLWPASGGASSNRTRGPGIGPGHGSVGALRSTSRTLLNPVG